MKGLPLALLLLAAGGLRAEEGGLAGAVIRSDQWTVRRAKDQEEFTGNVSYRNEGKTFTSDWALWDKKRRLFFSRGHSYAQRTTPAGDTIEAWSEQARYDITEQNGSAWSEDGTGVRFKRTTADGQIMHGTAEKASYTSASQELTLENSVRLFGSSQTARSERAVYNSPAKTLLLTGGPPIVEFADAKQTGAMQGQEIELHPDEGIAKARTHVRGWIHWASEEKSP